MSFTGHLWTLSTRLRRRPTVATGTAWSTSLEDPVAGTVRLSGRLDVPAEAKGLVVAVHGLGGSSASPYMGRTVAAAARLGLGCLRLELRGADRRGEDFYHAGLIEDLSAALASPALAAFENLYVVGWSLGGHTVLRWAILASSPRVRAAAAVCAPIELAASAQAFDEPLRWPYRQYVLGHLLEIYAAVAARRPVPLALAAARRIRTLRQWDEAIVAPRHGFADAADYYERMSAGAVLDQLRLPCLFVGSQADPMVPAKAVLPALARPPAALEVCWTRRGGHMGFPAGLDLGMGGFPGLESQVLGWLSRH